MGLTRSQAKSFYGRFGKMQDTQAFYEDAALDDLIAHAAFGEAANNFELGCGTGRFALRLTGGCRPITLDACFDPQVWSIEYRNVITQFGVTSAVLVASLKDSTCTDGGVIYQTN